MLFLKDKILFSSSNNYNKMRITKTGKASERIKENPSLLSSKFLLEENLEVEKAKNILHTESQIEVWDHRDQFLCTIKEIRNQIRNAEKIKEREKQKKVSKQRTSQIGRWTDYWHHQSQKQETSKEKNTKRQFQANALSHSQEKISLKVDMIDRKLSQKILKKLTQSREKLKIIDKKNQIQKFQEKIIKIFTPSQTDLLKNPNTRSCLIFNSSETQNESISKLMKSQKSKRKKDQQYSRSKVYSKSKNSLTSNSKSKDELSKRSIKINIEQINKANSKSKRSLEENEDKSKRKRINVIQASMKKVMKKIQDQRTTNLKENTKKKFSEGIAGKKFMKNSEVRQITLSQLYKKHYFTEESQQLKDSIVNKTAQLKTCIDQHTTEKKKMNRTLFTVPIVEPKFISVKNYYQFPSDVLQPQTVNHSSEKTEKSRQKSKPKRANILSNNYRHTIRLKSSSFQREIMKINGHTCGAILEEQLQI